MTHPAGGGVGRRVSPSCWRRGRRRHAGCRATPLHCSRYRCVITIKYTVSSHPDTFTDFNPDRVFLKRRKVFLFLDQFS